MAPALPVHLDVVSDVVCPWCYIGKHRLGRALARLTGAIDVAVRWRPYELNPALPSTGMDRRTYCERKFGSVEHADRLYARVIAAARADGLPLAVELITRTPNTRAAHRLLERAFVAGCQDALVDRLFAAYFVDGSDIGDVGVLLDLAAAAGLERAAAAACLEDAAGAAAVAAEERASAALGVTGVPAFVMNGRLLFAGAQSPETIALALMRAVARGL